MNLVEIATHELAQVLERSLPLLGPKWWRESVVPAHSRKNCSRYPAASSIEGCEQASRRRRRNSGQITNGYWQSRRWLRDLACGACHPHPYSVSRRVQSREIRNSRLCAIRAA